MTENKENEVIENANMTPEEFEKFQAEKKAIDEENKRRETLRQKVIADFVIMCSEFLYEEFTTKLKEMENKSKFFSDMGE